MKKIFLILLVAGIVSSCTSSNDFEKGKQQLESQGYTHVENTGHNYFCCSNDEQFSTGFKALDKNGKEVEGCFCSALGKGITIRFE